MKVAQIVSILLALSVGTWKLSAIAQAFDQRLTVVEKESFTKPQAAEQALRFAIENPGMRVPDPRNPGSVIQVGSVNKP